MLWFRELGNLLDKMTSPSQMTNSKQSLNYVTTGSITTISYKGTGNVVIALPTECKYDSFFNVSNNTILNVPAGSKAITLPDYGSTIVIIQGTYINAQ